MNKALWHNENRSLAYNHFNKECSKCKKKSRSIKNGVIHHISYDNINDKSVYAFDALFLISIGVITWVCKKCHNDIHSTDIVNGKTKILKECAFCKIRYGDIDRANSIDLLEPICRKCFDGLKEQKKLKENGQMSLF